MNCRSSNVKRFIASIFAMFLLGTLPATVVKAQSIAVQLEQADSLFDAHEEEQALELYEKILADDQKQFEALWQSSLLYSRLGGEQNEKVEKEYYDKAQTRAEQALELQPEHTQTNFVMAVAMGSRALVVGARERVKAAKDIKKYAERALQADSSNAGAWHVLGRWHSEISDLNFAERMAINIIYGGVPEGASIKKAEEYIQRAIALDPSNILYYYDLAVVYRRTDQPVKAISSCLRAQEMPAEADFEKETRENCNQLINDLQ